MPIVLTLATFYIGIWVYLRRVTYWEYRHAELPDVPFDDVFQTNFTKYVAAVDRCLLGALEGWRWKALLLATVLGFVSFRFWATLDGLEGAPVRYLTMYLFGLAALALVINAFRFVHIWSLFRNILVGLEKLPIRHALDRLPREKSLPLLTWRASSRSFLPLRQAVDRLRALLRLEPQVLSVATFQVLKFCIMDLERDLLEIEPQTNPQVVADRKPAAVDMQKEITFGASTQLKMEEQERLEWDQQLKTAVGAEGRSIFVPVSTAPVPGPVAVPDREPIADALDTVSTIDRNTSKPRHDAEVTRAPGGTWRTFLCRCLDMDMSEPSHRRRFKEKLSRARQAMRSVIQELAEFLQARLLAPGLHRTG